MSSDPTQPASRETFSSVWGAALALLGVSVGLGNIWRFPYMVGLYGGGAFLLVYLAVVLFVGVPALVAEMALGRRTRTGPLQAFARAGFPRGRTWGVVLTCGVGMAMSYYVVVLGWIVVYLAIAVGAPVGGPPLSTETFDWLQHDWWIQVVAVGFVLSLAALVVGRGVRSGIERVSRGILPVFALLIVALAGWSLTLPGAGRGLRFLFVPDWSALTAEAILAAVGQAFFSLSLGGTFFVIYGSYLSPEMSLPHRALGTAAGDVTASLMAAVAVVPVVFSFGLSPKGGPPLIFEVLPAAFGSMPAGEWFAIAFFLGLGCVAFLSGVAAMEVLVGSLVEWLGWSRSRTAWLLSALLVVLGLPSIWSVEYLFWSDLLWGSTMQPAGSVIALAALTWGFGRAQACRELAHEGVIPGWAGLWYAWIRYVVPPAVALALISGWFTG